jgi:hypothetical protein
VGDIAHVPILRGEAFMLNPQLLTMVRSSGAGELGVLEKAELPPAGEKLAAVGKRLREGRDQILDAIGLISRDGPETVEVLGLVVYGSQLTSV